MKSAVGPSDGEYIGWNGPLRYGTSASSAVLVAAATPTSPCNAVAVSMVFALQWKSRNEDGTAV